MGSGLAMQKYVRAKPVPTACRGACLILQPITPLLGVCNTLLLLIMNRHCAKKSSAAGFAGEFVALIVYQNSALGCATDSNQDNAKKNYSAHRFAYLFVAVGGGGEPNLCRNNSGISHSSTDHSSDQPYFLTALSMARPALARSSGNMTG